MWLILGLTVPFYVLAPIVFWLSHRMPLIPTRRLEPGAVPEPVGQALEEWHTALAPRGLVPVAAHELEVGHIEVYRGAGNRAYVLHLVNRAAGLHGLDYITPRHRWQVFITALSDSGEVLTSNFPLTDTFPPYPRMHTLRVSRERDLGRLYALHLAHVDHVAGRGATGVLPEAGALLDFVPEREREVLERQRALGTMTVSRDVYRPTFRSAFVMVWRMLPPLNWIRSVRAWRLRRTLQAAMAAADR
ncbi:MAG TPA: hypothetical protein VEQ60_12225 [Longimicrobium sp.]|nr:hypothetical protein [Longimicrobium sp.]